MPCACSSSSLIELARPFTMCLPGMTRCKAHFSLSVSVGSRTGGTLQRIRCTAAACLNTSLNTTTRSTAVLAGPGDAAGALLLDTPFMPLPAARAFRSACHSSMRPSSRPTASRAGHGHWWDTAGPRRASADWLVERRGDHARAVTGWVNAGRVVTSATELLVLVAVPACAAWSVDGAGMADGTTRQTFTYRKENEERHGMGHEL